MPQYLFPMPLKTHIIFAAISIVLLIAGYYKKRYKYQLVLACGIGCTFLVYLCENTRSLDYIGALELLILIIVCILMRSERKYRVYIPKRHGKAEHFKD